MVTSESFEESKDDEENVSKRAVNNFAPNTISELDVNTTLTARIQKFVLAVNF